MHALLVCAVQVFAGGMVGMWGVAIFVSDPMTKKILGVVLIASLGIPFAATNMYRAWGCMGAGGWALVHKHVPSLGLHGCWGSA